jgi:peptidoglycan/xylan/chitin deacetylase (PgdA/CDA1 family)
MSAAFALCALLFATDAAQPVDAGVVPDGAAASAQVAPLPPAAISSVTTSEPVVALTFDACATKKQANGFDRKVFEILARDQIPATLYLTGRWVERHPSAVKDIAAAPWIELGNHTYSHPRLTLVREERIHMQIRGTNRILKKKLGRPALDRKSVV